MELGTVDFWKATVCKTFPGITPGLWTGGNIQFFVSPDGTKITSTGSSIIIDGIAYCAVLGPINFKNVGSCEDFGFRILIPGEIPIKDNAFAGTASSGVFTLEGKFSSSILRTGIICAFHKLPLPAGEGWGGGSKT
jgi:hypothetical protein